MAADCIDNAAVTLKLLLLSICAFLGSSSHLSMTIWFVSCATLSAPQAQAPSVLLKHLYFDWFSSPMLVL
jgi:hypothetical protein